MYSREVPVLRCLCVFGGVVVILIGVAAAQPALSVGPNIDMVCGYGTDVTKCDASLNKQNEPSIAVSTRNPRHLIAGVNDYRGVAAGGDAFLGVLRSMDGGITWKGGLHPGCPEAGYCLPAAAIQGLLAGADPTVRCGPNGLCFYTGIAFDRDANGPGVVFVSRWLDDNNATSTNQDTFRYLETIVLDNNTSGQLQDKPWVAIDAPRAGSAITTIAGTSSVPTQSFPFGTVYVLYTTFLGSQNSSQVRIISSSDGGATWGKPVKVSASSGLVQGSNIAIDPITGTVVVVWRQFQTPSQPDAIMVVASTDKGRTFTTPLQVAAINKFDQPTTVGSIRITSYPAIAISVDSAGKSRVHVGWADRSGPNGDARVVMTTTTLDKLSAWPQPLPIDAVRSATDPPNSANPGTTPGTMRGHQFMPALTFANGLLVALYYDTRDDSTIGEMLCPAGQTCTKTSQLQEVRVPAGALPTCPDQVFTYYLLDNPTTCGTARNRRHTVDVRAAQALPSDKPVFTSSRVSQFVPQASASSSGVPTQRKFNAVDYPLFGTDPTTGLPTAAFLGDYIDIGTLAFVPTASGWAFNTSINATNSPVFYGTWTSNHTVIPNPPGCSGTLASRNQDTFIARISPGLVLTANRNSRPLGLVQHQFQLSVQNMTSQSKTFTLTIQPPANGTASFSQTDPTITTLSGVQVAAKSTISRAIYATSANSTTSIPVSVTESPAGGLFSTLVLNPDSTDPSLTTFSASALDQSNLDLGNFAVAAFAVNTAIATDLGNIDLGNIDLGNTDLGNTSLVSMDSVNTDLGNFAINTDLGNFTVLNLDLGNTDLGNTDLGNSAIQDVNTTVTNTAATDVSANVNTLVKDTSICKPTGSLYCQLIMTKVTTVPTVTSGCVIKQLIQPILMGNIASPVMISSDALNVNSSLTQTNLDGAIANATLAVATGEKLALTLRMVDPNTTMATTKHFCAPGVVQPTCIDPASNVKPVPVGKLASTGIIVLPLVSTTMNLPNGIVNQAYSQQLQAVGAMQPVWSGNGLPAGLSISNSGLLSGRPKSTGLFTFTVNVETGCPGAGCQTDSQTLNLTVTKNNGTF